MSGSFLLEVQELSRPSNICSISVRWYTSIKDIKDLLRNHFNAPPSRISIFHSSVPKALPNQFTLHDLGIEQDGHTLKVSINVQSSKSFVLFPSKDIEVDQNCKDMISISRQGFERSQIPGKTDLFDCTGGVYFLRAPSGEKHAVFKPNDEEQGMPNNPKGHAGSGVEALRPFFLPGRGYIRETAAYLMDFKNFCQVPPTTIVHCEHQCFNYPKNQGSSGMFPKVGSLQKFIYASDTFEDISPSLISTFELQKIAILDIRLLNCDRNSSNILCLRKPAPSYPSTRCGGRRDSRSSSMGSFPDEYDEDAEFNPFQDELPPSSFSANGAERPADYYELIPIDHGYCIPSRLKIDELDWAWFYCSQIAAEVDPEIRRYVLSLDVDQLVDDLAEQLKIPDVSCFLLRLSHHLLVEGIKAGLSLFTIAGLIARTSEDEPSFLEKAIKLAEENSYRTIEVRSNRLNSRGDSRAASFGSQSGSFLSPSRLRPFPSASSISRDISASMSDPVDAGSLDNSLYGHGRLSKFIDDQPDFTAGKRHRVVQSSANLEALVGQAMAKSTSNSKYAAFAATLQAAERPLSIENMEKLQLLNAGHGSQEHDDFYLAELSPQTYKAAAPAMEETHEEGIALNLVAPHELEGSKLVIMHSVDSATHSARFKSSHSSRSEKAPSRFSCGRLEEEEEAAAPPRPNVSADIAIPSPKKTGGLSPESDLTSCEASSKEDEACSPRSFGDNFFLTGESLLHRPSVPFGKSDHPLLATIDGSAGGSGKERPFPPRSSPLPPSGASRDCAEKRAKTSSHSPFYPNSDEDPETDMEVQDAMRLGISGSSQCGGLSAAGNIRRNDTSQASFLSKGAGTVTPTPLSGLQRVASFNAFESPALYEDRQTSHRQMKVLYKEQRKAISKTPEFLELRLKFARAAVNSFIAKEFKAKSKY